MFPYVHSFGHYLIKLVSSRSFDGGRPHKTIPSSMPLFCCPPYQVMRPISMLMRQPLLSSYSTRLEIDRSVVHPLSQIFSSEGFCGNPGGTRGRFSSIRIGRC
ncbi:hypothetical protein NPIL_335551 [Nephila pilipes]|uniref:Uncharacterized protein n=1 Tax=Nephila pilipes TaxID=299642 RepID=A0A8X6TU83_NEPPI|nr:hypothetical protein NPIL_335551 [Nephila pilipes]